MDRNMGRNKDRSIVLVDISVGISVDTDYMDRKVRKAHMEVARKEDMDYMLEVARKASKDYMVAAHMANKDYMTEVGHMACTDRRGRKDRT